MSIRKQYDTDLEALKAALPAAASTKPSEPLKLLLFFMFDSLLSYKTKTNAPL